MSVTSVPASFVDADGERQMLVYTPSAAGPSLEEWFGRKPADHADCECDGEPCECTFDDPEVGVFGPPLTPEGAGL